MKYSKAKELYHYWHELFYDPTIERMAIRNIVRLEAQVEQSTEEIEELKRKLISLQNSVLYERRLRSQAEWRAGIVSSDYSPYTPFF